MIDSNNNVNSIKIEIDRLGDYIWDTLQEKYINVKNFSKSCITFIYIIHNRVERYTDIQYPYIQENSKAIEELQRSFEHAQGLLLRVKRRFEKNSSNILTIGLISDRLHEEHKRFFTIYTRRKWINDLINYSKEYNVSFKMLQYLASNSRAKFTIDDFSKSCGVNYDIADIIIGSMCRPFMIKRDGKKIYSEIWLERITTQNKQIYYRVRDDKKEFLRKLSTIEHIINDELKAKEG